MRRDSAVLKATYKYSMRWLMGSIHFAKALNDDESWILQSH